MTIPMYVLLAIFVFQQSGLGRNAHLNMENYNQKEKVYESHFQKLMTNLENSDWK